MADTRELVVKFLTEGTEAVQASVKGLSKTLGGISNYAQSAQAASQKFAAGLGAAKVAAIGFIGVGAKIAGDFEAARQGFVTILGSAEEAGKVMERIKKEAARTPFELTGLTSATQALALVTKNGDKSIDVLLNVGKALAAAGKGQAELDRIIMNLQQIGLTGKITEMDIRQFGMNGVNILELLGDYYGVTTDKAGDMVKDSKDAFGDLQAAFAKAGNAGGKFANAFTNQAGTFNQLMSNLKDSFQITMSDIVVRSGAFDIIKNALGGLINFMNDNRDTFISALKTGFEWLKANAPLVAGVILGALTPAFVGLAMSIGGVLLTLAPFMIAGALLAPLVMGWIDSVGGVGPAFEKVTDTLKSLWNVVQMLITGDFKGGIFGLQEDDPWIDALLTVREVALDLAKKAFKFLAASAKLLGQVFEFLKPSIMALLNALLPLGQAIFNVFEALKPQLTIVATVLGVVLVGAIWLFINALRIVIQVLTFVLNAYAAFGNAFNSLVGWLLNVPNMIVNVWNSIVGGAIAFLETLKNIFVTAITNYVNFWLTLPERIAFAMGMVAAFLLIKVPEIVNNVVNWFAQLPGRIWGVLTSLPGLVANAFNHTKNIVTGIMSSLWGSAVGAANHIVNSLVNTFFSLPGRLGGLAGALGHAIGDAIRNLPRFLGDIWSWAWSVVREIGRAIANKLGALSGAFKAGWRAMGGPAFQHGGIVPGGPNQAVPILAHGGERIIPRTGVDVNSQGGMSGGITVNFYGDVAMDSDDRVRQLAMEVKRMLDRENKLYNLGAL